MLLSTEAAHGAIHGKVFLIYGAFWVVALVTMFFGIGFLMKRAKASRQHHDGHK